MKEEDKEMVYNNCRYQKQKEDETRKSILNKKKINNQWDYIKVEKYKNVA